MLNRIIQKSAPTDDDMKKIRQFTRRELEENEIYTFNVALCDNDVDRDFEKFSLQALKELQGLFVGKTGIFDHSMKTGDQKARIFDTYIERIDGKSTADGEDYYCLMAKAYMLNNEENSSLINDIDAGIKKEVSVSCSMEKSICSICNADRRTKGCEHRRGKSYNGKLCFDVLSDATDAYEFSFVAVPAQRQAGVRKSFCQKEKSDMKSIIKSIYTCEEDLVISKAQAKELSCYIDSLKDEARLGEEYKRQLAKEVVSLLSKSFPNMDKALFSSVASVMTTKELIGFKDGLQKEAKQMPKPQLASANHTIENNNSDFKI